MNTNICKSAAWKTPTQFVRKIEKNNRNDMYSIMVIHVVSMIIDQQSVFGNYQISGENKFLITINILRK